MNLFVKVTKTGRSDSGLVWKREETEQMNVTHIRAYYIVGDGSAQLHYQAKDDNGEWHDFLKKENKDCKLPSISKRKGNWTQSIIDVKGIRGVYKYISEEIELR